MLLFALRHPQPPPAAPAAPPNRAPAAWDCVLQAARLRSFAVATCVQRGVAQRPSPTGPFFPPLLQVLPTARFVLRARAPDGGAAPSSGPASSGGAASSGGGRGVLEDLPSSLPNGDEVFLASLGYEAPGPYELLIASAPQVGQSKACVRAAPAACVWGTALPQQQRARIRVVSAALP